MSRGERVIVRCVNRPNGKLLEAQGGKRSLGKEKNNLEILKPGEEARKKTSSIPFGRRD